MVRFASRTKPTKVATTNFFQKMIVWVLALQTKKRLCKKTNFSQTYSSSKLRCFQKMTKKRDAKLVRLIRTELPMLFNVILANFFSCVCCKWHTDSLTTRSPSCNVGTTPSGFNLIYQSGLSTPSVICVYLNGTSFSCKASHALKYTIHTMSGKFAWWITTRLPKCIKNPKIDFTVFSKTSSAIVVVRTNQPPYFWRANDLLYTSTNPSSLTKKVCALFFLPVSLSVSLLYNLKF